MDQLLKRAIDAWRQAAGAAVVFVCMIGAIAAGGPGEASDAGKSGGSAQASGAAATSPAAEPLPAATTSPAAGSPVVEAALAMPSTAPSVPRADRLVRRLADSDWRVRESASAELNQIGQAAEPRLRELLTMPLDPQTQTGIQRVLRRIEMHKDVGPTLVTLHLKGASPREALAELSRQGGITIDPLTERLWDREWPTIDLDAKGRPFWEVMRQVCVKSGLRALYQDGEEGLPRWLVSKDVLGEMSSPAAFSGSFMVLATKVSRRPSYEAVENGGPPTATVDLQFTFFADPKWRIAVAPDEAPIDAITDASGRPLARPQAMHLQAYCEGAPLWMMRTLAARMPTDGARFARIGGSFAVEVVEQSKPVAFEPVADARNVVRRAGRQSVHLHYITHQDGLYQARLTIQRAGLGDEDWRSQREIEGINLLDSHNKSWRRSLQNVEQEGELVTYDLVFTAPDGAPGEPAAAVKLVCQLPGKVRSVNVPFELKDVPIEP